MQAEQAGQAGEPVLEAPLLAITRELRECLCATLARYGRPVCHCCLYHGRTPPPADDCGCDCEVGQGRGWVRVVQLTTSSSSAIVTPPCNVWRWKATLELGVYRCVTVPEDGVADCGVQSAEAVAGWTDLLALRDVVACCRTEGGALEDAIVEVLSGDPLGPSGGCAGSTLTFTVEI